MSIIGEIRDKLNEVVGPTGNNQYMSLMMPGIPLDQDEFKPKKGEEVLARIAESRLADQLYDIGKVVGGSNGKKLSETYKSILSMVVPNPNPDLVHQQHEIEEWLNQKIDTDQTRLQAYQAAVQKYVDAQQAWSNEQSKKRGELNPAEFESWYDDNALAMQTKLESLEDAANAFVPQDIMDITRAMLAIEGPAAKAHHQIAIMKAVTKGSSDGGERLPVAMEPQDWADSIKSNFSPIDLLSSPEQIERQIAHKQEQLADQQSTADALIGALDAPADVAAKAKALSDAKGTPSNAC